MQFSPPSSNTWVCSADSGLPKMKTFSPSAAASSQWPLAAAVLGTGLLISCRSWALVLLPSILWPFWAVIVVPVEIKGKLLSSWIWLCMAWSCFQCVLWVPLQNCVHSEGHSLPCPEAGPGGTGPWNTGLWSFEMRWWLPQSSPLTALERRHGIWDITSHWGRCCANPALPTVPLYEPGYRMGTAHLEKLMFSLQYIQACRSSSNTIPGRLEKLVSVSKFLGKWLIALS